MKLLLMRHGEASLNAPTDAQRPLTQRGRACVLKQGQNTNIPWHEFTHLFASPYIRAQQTASLLVQNYASSPCSVSQHSHTCITPHGEVGEVQDFLLNQPGEGIILVTHQPLISGLIGHFCHANKHEGAPMMPASMALLEGDIAAAGCLNLIHLLHP
ncbi:MAG: phosphohistidine phosphatase SixA [Gammaproteobacteria bacterium]|nr:phosphohistidine phosphatase SixA [Gammaproteobacteria bacterium]